jgi:hypothetical protein
MAMTTSNSIKVNPPRERRDKENMTNFPSKQMMNCPHADKKESEATRRPDGHWRRMEFGGILREWR